MNVMEIREEDDGMSVRSGIVATKDSIRFISTLTGWVVISSGTQDISPIEKLFGAPSTIAVDIMAPIFRLLTTEPSPISTDTSVPRIFVKEESLMAILRMDPESRTCHQR